MRLDDRKSSILTAAIREYISSVEPVGSQRLVEKYRLDVSPATVRHELAELEAMGYLWQPHTSAGRVPTDKGYRFFVDRIADVPELVTLQTFRDREVESLFSALSRHMEDTIRGASVLLARLTSCVSVVLAPAWERSILRRVDLLALSRHTVLMVLITDTGLVLKHVVQTDREVPATALGRIERLLNRRLALTDLRSIHSHVESVASAMGREAPLARFLLDEMVDCLRQKERERLIVEGTIGLLRQPEFEDLARVSALLATLEQGYVLLRWLEDALDAKRVVVRIGSENREREIQHFSLVARSYEFGGEEVGTIGLIGPTRMDYPVMISAVEYVTRSLSEALNGMRS